ncbi:hypothetical protein CK203_080465 [Vitis vinifera]|uniref:DUF4283 domain-containing protein n=1 Tax=Vitis vinifera TaxID=29760 RepID=A0A438E7A7_VITVI|nr:hypothetical protein CK203_080465 [Vitis vinifera]
MEDRRGKIQGLIVEKKGRVSSWVRLGSDSLGFFLEGLNLCIKGEKEERWGREWKEQGRIYSMTRGINRGRGVYKARGLRYRREEVLHFHPERKPGRKDYGEGCCGRSYATMVKRTLSGNPNVIVVKVEKEESIGLLQKLEHCVVTSWRDRFRGENDLEKLGKLWARSWDLKGSLRLAKLDKERALLD